jgi:hypothetical protein
MRQTNNPCGSSETGETEMCKPMEALAKAPDRLCRLVLQRDIEQEAMLMHGRSEAHRIMRELKSLGYAEKSDGVWKLTLSGRKRMQEVEAQLRARR